MKHSFSITALSISILLSVACRKEDRLPSPPGYNNAAQTSELEVPSDFNWKTSGTITVIVNPKQNGPLLIMDIAGVIYHKAYLSGNEAYEVSISVPETESNLYLYFNGQQEVLPMHFHQYTSKLQ